MSQRLIYVMDPMCSWCWGFAPVIDAIQAAFPQLDLHLVPGGLRPGVTDPMQDSTRLALAEHWQAVHAATGQPVLTPDDLPAAFVYNTEPACRVLVVGRELDAGKLWALVKAIQSAFYTQAIDVTQAGVLTDLAEGAGYSRNDFIEAFDAPETRVMLAADFAWVGDLGISGFPTLLAERNGQLALLGNGYQPAASLLPLLRRWVEAGDRLQD
ncbi:DSBA oxidoreductase [Halopseudomonas bauzanensis]|nr:DSBA oxidoreductase [Halopseudomonas bauzanensis]